MSGKKAKPAAKVVTVTLGLREQGMVAAAAGFASAAYRGLDLITLGLSDPSRDAHLARLEQLLVRAASNVRQLRDNVTSAKADANAIVVRGDS